MKPQMWQMMNSCPSVFNLLMAVHHVKNSLPFMDIDLGVTGMTIADDILSKLVEWQLQPQLMCGQAYDEAGEMAGKSKGVASCILSMYPKALYTHCAAHRLV